MYCANCASPLTQGLSYCNRCGISLRDRVEPKNTAAITAFLSAITVLGVLGLMIMVLGALALRTKGGLAQDLVALFMLFTFLIVGVTELMLVKQLSRLTGSSSTRALPGMESWTQELKPAQPMSLAEPGSSVTDNTTRTLEFSRRPQ